VILDKPLEVRQVVVLTGLLSLPWVLDLRWVYRGLARLPNHYVQATKKLTERAFEAAGSLSTSPPGHETLLFARDLRPGAMSH